MSEEVPCPTVFCLKEGTKVPVWYCIGSFIQQREPCPNIIKLTVSFAENYAEVECKLQKRR